MMRKEFVLPDIGEGIVECEVVDWLIEEGQVIEEDQAVVDVMTDKALVQIPAPFSGTITKLYYKKGEIAKVHKPLFEIDVQEHPEAEPLAEISLELASSPCEQDLTDEEFLKHVRDMPLYDEAPAVISELSQAVGDTITKAVASPAVRRLARHYEIDLSGVQGSGKHGRIYKEDLEAYRKAKEKSASIEVIHEHTEQLSPMQRKMAEAMTHSVQTIPHFTYCDEFDVTELVTLRARMQQKKQNMSFMPFFIKALSMSLLEFPRFNSQLNQDVTEITYLSHHHIGFALDSKLGLLVPNIKDCQHKTIDEIHDDMQRIMQQGKAGRIAPEDLQQGTITISNIGSIGGTVATPIIHQGQVAIVALGKIQALPRFDAQGQVQARQMMQVSWSADHRVVDGAMMARFCNAWKKLLESPEIMLIHMR